MLCHTASRWAKQLTRQGLSIHIIIFFKCECDGTVPSNICDLAFTKSFEGAVVFSIIALITCIANCCHKQDASPGRVPVCMLVTETIAACHSGMSLTPDSVAH